jgi:hypothetical protein
MLISAGETRSSAEGPTQLNVLALRSPKIYGPGAVNGPSLSFKEELLMELLKTLKIA